MRSSTVSDPDTVLAAYADYDAACAKLAELNYDTLSLPELLALQSRREEQARRAPAVDHALLAEIQTRTTAKEIGAKNWADMLAIRLRITTTEANRRLADAAVLAPRRAVTGEPLPPVLPATAAAQAAGTINTEHVAIIRKFLAKPPVPLDAATHAQIDADLARIAAGNSPDILTSCVQRLRCLLNQDGDRPLEDIQARRRGITLGPQDADGMRKMSGWITPEASAILEPTLAKFAAPGMCDPDSPEPCTSGTPSRDDIAADTRTTAQRTHDALMMIGRLALAAHNLGQHHGVPVSIIVTTTLRDMQTAAGEATTAGGTRMSVGDLIRMAAQSDTDDYLAVFDDHREVPLYFGRARRTASPGQRLAMFARDKGCTRPGCTCAADRCQAHHAKADFSRGGLTDITDLTLACPKSNRLVHDHGWTTHIRDDGRVEWIPPPLLDTGQDRINHYWHPEDLFHPPNNDDP